MEVTIDINPRTDGNVLHTPYLCSVSVTLFRPLVTLVPLALKRTNPAEFNLSLLNLFLVTVIYFPSDLSNIGLDEMSGIIYTA